MPVQASFFDITLSPKDLLSDDAGYYAEHYVDALSCSSLESLLADPLNLLANDVSHLHQSEVFDLIFSVVLHWHDLAKSPDNHSLLIKVGEVCVFALSSFCDDHTSIQSDHSPLGSLRDLLNKVLCLSIWLLSHHFSYVKEFEKLNPKRAKSTKTKDKEQSDNRLGFFDDVRDQMLAFLAHLFSSDVLVTVIQHDFDVSLALTLVLPALYNAATDLPARRHQDKHLRSGITKALVNGITISMSNHQEYPTPATTLISTIIDHFRDQKPRVEVIEGILLCSNQNSVLLFCTNLFYSLTNILESISEKSSEGTCLSKLLNIFGDSAPLIIIRQLAIVQGLICSSCPQVRGSCAHVLARVIGHSEQLVKKKNKSMMIQSKRHLMKIQKSSMKVNQISMVSSIRSLLFFDR
ncbi:hypothetical protein GEMRC1_004029 [Eukaryota sp. GEM-RC1]